MAPHTIINYLYLFMIQKWIIFKVLFMTHKCLHGMSAAYLSNLLTLKPSRGLRSDDQMLLVVPISKIVNYGDTAFSYAAPVLWNALQSTSDK